MSLFWDWAAGDCRGPRGLWVAAGPWSGADGGRCGRPAAGGGGGGDDGDWGAAVDPEDDSDAGRRVVAPTWPSPIGAPPRLLRDREHQDAVIYTYTYICQSCHVSHCWIHNPLTFYLHASSSSVADAANKD